MSAKDSFSAVIQQWAATFMHHSLRDFRRFMDESGLSMSQISILMRLFYQGGCGVSQIGGHLGVTNAAASQTVDRLVQMRLLERTEDPLDRRAKLLNLTPEGRRLIEQGIQARRSWMESLTERLTPEQQETIIAALTLLNEATGKLEQPGQPDATSIPTQLSFHS